ncbi:Calcium-transporting ATPase, endoplasmic reticulum-type [Trebouxia sp. C0009 RCD-2024]
MAVGYAAWARSVQDVADHYRVDLQDGLTEDQVAAARAQHGRNELEKQPGKPLWKLVLEQFDDMLVKVLLLAALVSFALAYFEEGSSEDGIRAYIEPFVILLILVLNAIVGVWQESNAEAALEALTELQSEHASVTRQGKQIFDLPAVDLVPGDLVELHVGDKVPADIRLVTLKTATLRLEQASLTGEAMPVHKELAAIAEEDCELQAKDNMLFAGTAVVNGHCFGIVNNIGMTTEIGKIQQQIHDAASEEEDTPLKKKLDHFGEVLAQVIFWICVLVWAINYKHFLSWKNYKGSFIPNPATVEFSLSGCIYYFKIAVALAVAAIPEGLPAVITTCLALGTRKMAKRNAIVRKLPSVETLGCTTVICSDKTGTLTTNQMSCVKLIGIDESGEDLRELTVEGTTFDPTIGHVHGLSHLDRNLEALSEVCAVCNDAHIEFKEGRYHAVGAPTEAALVVLVEKLGVADAGLNSRIQQQRAATPEGHADGTCQAYCRRWEKMATLEFDRNRKSMSVIASASQPSSSTASGVTTRSSAKNGSDNSNVLFVKGAAEYMLNRCSKVMLQEGRVQPLSPALRAKATQTINHMAGKALRCLAFAQKTDLGDLSSYDGAQHPAHGQLTEPSNYLDIEKDLTLLGFAGLEDPPRSEVSGAVRDCQLAGIRVIVITGDNKLTAEAICRKVGVFAADEDLEGKSITGVEFMKLPLDKRRSMLAGNEGACFSRAEPKHKQDIVRLLREMGHIVAMTGDGVNDAPALKLADIGVAMGITGTEVAKEASDMVLADDNFSTIVAAVEEGRAIYNNMKAFIRYMISSNVGEVASIFFTAALGLPEGLIPVQLLWVNLVTDGPPATALGFNPPDLDIMDKPPRSPTEGLVSPWTFVRWMVVGCYVGFATVAAFAFWYMFDNVLGVDLSQDGHSTVTWYQLTHYNQCSDWPEFQASPYTAGAHTFKFSDPCDYFTYGKAKASTLSLSVLVAIEMFNAMNALSEDNSLLQMPPWKNPYLLLACAVSFGLHFLILYVPFLADIFSIVPLSFNEWLFVLLLSLPVILLDEVLKFIGRHFINTQTGSQVMVVKKTQ